MASAGSIFCHVPILYAYSLNKSSMWFWIRKVSLPTPWKPKMAICDVNCGKCYNINNYPFPLEHNSGFKVYHRKILSQMLNNGKYISLNNFLS